MNVMLCFPVAEERQVRSGDIKLNLADNLAINLWCDLLSCFTCQIFN